MNQLIFVSNLTAPVFICRSKVSSFQQGYIEVLIAILTGRKFLSSRAGLLKSQDFQTFYRGRML